MNANLLLVGVTVVTMLWLVLAAPTVIAQTWPGAQTFQERPQAQQVALSGQERLQRQWQWTIEKAYAQRAILRAWHERVLKAKQASTKADTRSQSARPLRVTRAGR